MHATVINTIITALPSLSGSMSTELNSRQNPDLMYYAIKPAVENCFSLMRTTQLLPPYQADTETFGLHKDGYLCCQMVPGNIRLHTRGRQRHQCKLANLGSLPYLEKRAPALLHVKLGASIPTTQSHCWAITHRWHPLRCVRVDPLLARLDRNVVCSTNFTSHGAIPKVR